MSYFEQDEDRLADVQRSRSEPKLLHSIECRHCGKAKLHWEEDDDGWVLMEGPWKMHQCKTEAIHAHQIADFDSLD